MASFDERRAAPDADNAALGGDWKRLSRAATFVAVLTSPALFVALKTGGWSTPAALLGTIAGVVAFRGLIDLIAHRLIPRPSLLGADREELLDDATDRRRVWFWRGKYLRLLPTLLVVAAVIYLIGLAVTGLLGFGSISSMWSSVQSGLRQNPLLAVSTLMQLALFPLFFLFNILILFGPLLVANLRQMKGYEPGDADWGVRLSDVRGQREPKEEVTRVITLWQSGEEFRRAGGKPERGLLFIGAPGTGKTMLSKAIATSFNSPIVTMPGSGFAATFIGIDVIVVLFLIRKARKLARKWGGQCIVFIDEIDAVGLRRQALAGGDTVGGGMTPAAPAESVESFHDLAFHGPHGALTSTGDLILETRAWREKLFAQRAPSRPPLYPPLVQRVGQGIAGIMFPGAMGGMGYGGMALNQLLVQMDGVDEPAASKKFWTNRINTLLDATYVVPRKVGDHSLRLRPPKPRPEQIYFIGATNVPIDRLDPALIRPGRMGRHIWFRTPTKDDRRDIFDLYLEKVSHDSDLDSDKRRDELARITHGYSPAMIEQVCSMALTLAHSDARNEFGWGDIVEAMTTIESGTAQGIDYVPEETKAVAIHEAGHAVASHVYMQDVLSTRLSIRKRGGSLGHHQAIEREERFSSWRHEEVGKLVWTLGAMAAEHVFYGENSTGVGGDVQSATTRAAWMVGMCGMGPEPIDLNGRLFDSEEQRREEEQSVMDRFERVGMQIMNRARGAREQGDAIAAILGDPAKRAAAAQILGQAYITAVCLIRHNREQVLHIAETLVNRRELHGDEVVEVLDAARLQAPSIDIGDETIWPKL
ncbi:MAG TPA: AAA family ATPase [Solirubrobacteraceae bacterium]|nr:AAA family ATPase [Solirubrobacteraceae bacterium]